MVKLQKVIMRFLQLGPVSKFSRMAALPGAVMLAHTEVCAHDNSGWKEPDWVSGQWGSVLSSMSCVTLGEYINLSEPYNPELWNLENEAYYITYIIFKSYKMPSQYKLMLLFLTVTILRKLLKFLGALEIIFSPCQAGKFFWNCKRQYQLHLQ